MDAEQLKEIIRDSGIIGAGGAGFPSYAKLSNQADTLILNCAECEPLLKVHRQLLAEHAYEIMTMMMEIAKVCSIENVYISLKGSYKDTVEAVEAEHESFPKIKVHFLKEVYPVGDEVILVYETTGRIVPAGGLPIQIGVTVFNVETIYNMYLAVHEGKPVTHKYLTVAGEVKNPCTLRVPIGMAASKVVELAGGQTRSDVAYIMGGPATGRVIARYEVITKTTNAILVLPQTSSLIGRKQASVKIDMKRAMASCCQCQMCTDLCPRFLLGHPVEPHSFMRSATSGVSKNTKVYLDTYFCCACGVCELFSCPQGLSPRALMQECKAELRKNGVPTPNVTREAKADPARSYRLVSMKRFIGRLGLQSYNLPAPMDEKDVVPSSVTVYLNQNIGAPALPQVKKGDAVTKGDILAKAPEGKLSVNVHASITGIIRECNERFIRIDSVKTGKMGGSHE